MLPVIHSSVSEGATASLPPSSIPYSAGGVARRNDPRCGHASLLMRSIERVTRVVEWRYKDRKQGAGVAGGRLVFVGPGGLAALQPQRDLERSLESVSGEKQKLSLTARQESRGEPRQ